MDHQLIAVMFPEVGQNRDTTIDIPWFSEPLMDLDRRLQNGLSTIPFFLSTFLEFSASTSFFWPCWSELATLLQTSYVLAFYWMMFNETETSRYIIIIAIYATHLVTVFAADSCGIFSNPTYFRAERIESLNSLAFLH